MSDMISGLAGQLFQKMIENQSARQTAPTGGGRSFESYLQQEVKPGGDGQTAPVEKTTEPRVSGAELSKRLDELEAELARSYREQNQTPGNFKQMMPELLESKSRLGLLRDAYSKIGATNRVTSDLPGRFVQVENEYKAVEAIMHSDKNLSTGELLALQARLYQVGQHIEVMSKVVDQMAGGIKTVLNTNV